MKLYYAPGACSLSPHILLRELGLPVELEKVDFKTGTYSGGDFKKINPKGYVPVIEMKDGGLLTENVAISQYIADQKPEAKFIPAPGTTERYRCTEWQSFLNSEVHKPFGPIFKNAPEAEKGQALDTLGKRFGYINDQLAGKKFLMGEQINVADIYLFVMTQWAEKIKLDLKGLSNLTQWRERMLARPAVQAALKAEEQAS